MTTINPTFILINSFHIYNLVGGWGGNRGHFHKKWGISQSSNIEGIYKKTIIIINIFNIIFKFKKALFLLTEIGHNFGICLALLLFGEYFLRSRIYFDSNYRFDYFLRCYRKSGFLDQREKETVKRKIDINNFFFGFLDQWMGFLSNFTELLDFKRYYPIRYSYLSDYSKQSVPDILFVGSGSCKDHNYNFGSFAKLRIINIRAGKFKEEDINVCYNIFIGRSFKLFFLFRSMYKLFFEYKKLKW